MLQRLRNLQERFILWVYRFNHHDNLVIRKIFRDRYNIDVGLYSYGCFDRWRMPGPLRVGRWCSIASSVRSAAGNHPVSAITTYPALYEKRFGVVDNNQCSDVTLVIEDDVWIGHNALLLPGCKHIGRGAIIGGGSVVTHDVPAYTIVAGNPARPLRARFETELQEAVEASRWWELDIAPLSQLVASNPDLVFHPTVKALQEWSLKKAGGRA